MSQAISPLTALLLGVAILFFGNGLQGVLLPVRATLEAFATTSIGLIASAYSAGFMVGCFCMPYIVRRVGHIRTFAVCAAIAASVVLLMVLAVHPVVWIPLRALSGICFAGLFMVIESWLNERATSINRGQVLAVYMVINLTAVTIGQMILPLGDPAGFSLFALTAIAITLALVPVGLTTSSAPQPLREVRLRLRRLYAMSPVGVVGGFFVGLANGAFGGLGAVFATQIGLSITGVALFMSASLVGGALAQLPIGRVSDRTDRRKVIVAVCVLAAATGGLLALFGGVRLGGLLPGPGADLATTSPLALIALVTLFAASPILTTSSAARSSSRRAAVSCSPGRSAPRSARCSAPSPWKAWGSADCFCTPRWCTPASPCSRHTGSASGPRCRPRSATLTLLRPDVPRAPHPPALSSTRAPPRRPTRRPRSHRRRSPERLRVHSIAEASSAPREAMKYRPM
jgi:MFS family permease